MSSGCGDVLSLEDLKTAKKHQTFEAEVITGKAGGLATGAEIYVATNPVTGQVQKTLPAILRDMGFDPAAFDFNTGGTVTSRDTVVYNPADNNWYSWAGALPHVVAAGTDPTADSNWKPRTDQLLRQELRSEDGARLVGKCLSVGSLRLIEPITEGQSIILERAVSDGPLINAVLTYDASDTTTADDGFSVFVTPNGARWKYDISSGYDVRLAGYSKSRNNIADCLNKIISAIVAGIVADGAFTTQQCVINIYSDSAASVESEHVVSETVLIPTFITMKHHGGRHIYKANDDIVAFKVDNAQFYTSHGLTWAIMTSGYGDGSKLKSNAVKKVIFDGPQGVWVMGPGKGASTLPGVVYGQTGAVSGSVAVDSDVSLNHLNVSKFKYSLQLGIINTYNLYIDDCYLDGVEYGIMIPNGASSNAGETVHVRGGTITAGQSSENDTGYGIYSDALAFNLTCSHVHIDNVVNTVLYLGPHATYSHFRFNNCWIESFNKLVECPAMYTGNIPRVYFRDIEFEGRTNDGVTWGGPRQTIDAGTTYVLSIEDSTITYYRKPGKNCKTVALAGTDSKGMARIKHGSYFGATSAFMAPRPYPIDIASSIRGLALFSGTEGAEAITTFDTSQLILTKSGLATAVYGPPTDMDGKFQSLVLTATATTDVIYIYPRHKVFLQRGDSIAASCSIKLNNASGNVNVSACLLNYFSENLSGTVSGTTATIAKAANLNSTIQGSIVEDVLTYLAVSGTALTTSDFVGVEPVWVSQSYTALTDNSLTSGYEYSLPALKITGFVGSIHISLPFWWRI